MAGLSNPSLLYPCENCGTLVDATDAVPLSRMHCPNCGRAFRAKTQFHHFQLLEVLGSGGMGAVYRAQDLSLNRTVALKLLRTEHMADPAIVAQFEKEAAITAAINHPHVVKVFSTGTDHGTFYIAMELVDKGSLDELMTLQRRVAESQVLNVGIQIAQGLLAASKCGLIHRDVKPANILFADARTAKIVDFGLAALADPTGHSGEVGGEVWGTPYYVAPEKLELPPQEDFRSDMYSLGSALFHAIAGRPPYEAEDASIVVLKILKSKPVSLQSFAPDVSSATAYVINRMLAKDPDERYQSYEELIEHLEYARAKIAEHPPALTSGASKADGSSWLTLSVLALIVAIGVFFYLRNRPPGEASQKSPASAESASVKVDLDKAWDEARQLLISGQSARAAQAFRELDRDGVPQPLRNWCALHARLAELLDENPAAATTSLRQLEARGLFSADPGEERLGRFFVESAALAAGDRPVSPELAEKLNGSGHEAIGLLLYGMKNWTLGEFATAAQFLEKFQASKPEGRNAWIAEYQPIAAAHLADFAAFTVAARAVAAAADAPAKNKDALAAVKAAQAQLRVKSGLIGQLAAMEPPLVAAVEAFDAETARKAAAQDAADAAVLGGARVQIEGACQQLRLGDARKLLDQVAVGGDKAKAELDLLRTKIEWLLKFKSGLLADLRTLGYTGPLKKTAGAAIGAGGTWTATEAGVEVSGTYGKFQVLWPEIAPESVLVVAESFLRPTLGQEQLADRTWRLGIYLLVLRREPEARTRLAQAGAVKPEYREALARLGLGAATQPK